MFNSPENLENLNGCRDLISQCPLIGSCSCPNKYNREHIDSDCGIVKSIRENNMHGVFRIMRQAMTNITDYSRSHH